MAVLLGVYRDPHDANALAEELRRRGVAPAAIRLGLDEDRRASLSAEMEAEVADGWGSPGLGTFMTAEQTRGAVVFTVVFGAAGAVLGALLGALLLGGGLDAWLRALLGAGLGALFLGTVGTIVGGGFAMRSPADRLAAEEGVTVRVDSDDPGVRAVMERYRPIRLDRVEGGRYVGTVQTEGPQGIPGTLEEFRRNAEDPDRHG